MMVSILEIEFTEMAAIKSDSCYHTDIIQKRRRYFKSTSPYVHKCTLIFLRAMMLVESIYVHIYIS